MPVTVKRAPRIKSKTTNVSPISAMKGTKLQNTQVPPEEELVLPKFACGGKVKKK